MATPSPPVPPDNEDICAWVEFLGGDVERLRLRFGGRQIYIPHSVPGAHPLVETLGFNVANRLCQELTGVTAYVPKSPSRTSRLLVLILTWAGLGAHRIAELGGFTSRHILSIRAELRNDGFLPPADRAGNSHTDERY